MKQSVRIAVLGAGMSGICMGVQLKKRGIHDFVILEKAETVGGTWRENTYPGVACDVPSHVYSYSFELNPNWSHSYSTGREIWDYCESIVQKHDLKPHMRFGAEISNVRKDVWKDRVETFRTMMVPGFPNFFLLLGPNSATGHASALIMIESQVQYILRCLDLMEREGVKHLDPDPVRQYNRRLQKDMKGLVFSGGCNAWYTDANDHNFTLWPYSAARFIAELQRINKSDFSSSAKL